MPNPLPTPTAPQVVSLRQQDLQDAAHDGVITPAQAQSLWQRWVVLDHQATVPTQPGALASGPKFGFVNVLYYFGGLVAIGAMTLFMTLGFQAMGPTGLLLIGLAYLVACLKVADHFKARGLLVPAGILATLAVILSPLAVWCVQHLLGLWPPGGSDSYRAYHTIISWRWMTLEFATLATGVVMLWRYRLPFMVMPIAMTIWYMSMDVANGLMQQEGFDWEFSRDVSLVFGIATCCIAMWVDMRSRRAQEAEWRQDFAFWLYVLGAIMFWGGLSWRDSGSEIGKFVYALINIVMVLFGAAIGRRVFTIFGALGVAGYLGYLSHRVFEDSLLFPFALTLLGLAVVALGVWWQRHEPAINARLARFVPEGLRPRV
ncbi:hypothetical protein [Rhodoferax saidenbachensis]|uniref:DUF2157 domain-containing protein n=1 Tax=Rhodoferax saidenbachensis TaxID=1484693 RepID=A0A1P8KC48_9BURK|nr:hypothetical protein [Rhodoferax saidenbachensis]APW43590.1 DUF2157 domain-containing protein [Rhodoferax saidenbachensis]